MSKIETLGFQPQLYSYELSELTPEQQVGRVVSVERGRCSVDTDAGLEAQATIAGRVREMPVVEDWVVVSSDRVIVRILPRAQFLARRLVGRRSGPQVIAANLQRLFIL